MTVPRGALLPTLACSLALVATACFRSPAGTGEACSVRAERWGCAAPSTKAIESALDTNLAPPRVGGRGSVAPSLPPGARPAHLPVNAGEALRGHPLPTNRWWTSALVGPWTQPLVAGPLAVQVTEAGVSVSYRPPVVARDHVLQPFAPAVLVPGPLDRLRVTGYGAFDVLLECKLASGGSVLVRIVQGSPYVSLGFRSGAEPLVRLLTPAAATRSRGASLTAVVDGQRWDVVARSGEWRHSDAGLRLSSTRGETADVLVAAAPAGAGPGWTRLLEKAVLDPVVGTTEALTYDAARGVARQVLTVRRAGGGAGPWALTPLQRKYAVGSPARLAGAYASSTGRMPLVEARSVAVEVPLPAFLPAVPRLPLEGRARRAMLRELARDVSEEPAGGGSYFGLKELARQANVVEVAAAMGDRKVLRRMLPALRRGAVDWLTYDGPADPRYFAYDAGWGGLVAVPPEFGAQDYNDHHLQYGYLVKAAAVLAERDPAFREQYGSAVDAVVRDYAGGTTGLSGGLPSERAWDAGAAHSWASGFALFADGNNQESSSEAVAAWSAIARWGLATGRERIARIGLARYALEAVAARMYWLGEGDAIPDGYGHPVVGIVWGSKIDYATWFSPAPAAVHGIQLLPVGFDVLYRQSPRAARVRMQALLRESGGAIRQWGNLFATELGLFDPAAARAILASGPPDREPSTSGALVHYLVEALSLGVPDPRLHANPPFGLALRSRDGHLLLLAANPTARARTVAFLRGDRVLARVRVSAHGYARSRIR